jgi:hypothetical protein
LTVRQVESYSDIRQNGELYSVADAIEVAVALRKAKRAAKEVREAEQLFERERIDFAEFFKRQYPLRVTIGDESLTAVSIKGLVKLATDTVNAMREIA